MKKLLFFISILFIFSSCVEKKKISFSSLLDEITNRESLAGYPDPYYTSKQFSSFDRASLSAEKGSFDWFANWDFSHFLRTEENNGRREFVLYDAEGPGAVVRFWVTVSHYNDNGTLRFYFDNSTTPEIEGEVLSLISGGTLVGPPLSVSVSELTNYKQRGHNLYLPIPYREHCKITYESPGIIQSGRNPGENFFYNIVYRTYEKGTDVTTFSMNDLSLHSEKINQTQQKLLSKEHINDNCQKEEVEEISISPTETKLMISTDGGGAIKSLSVKLKAPDFEQALRSTILKIAFDDNNTVWTPIGDFFGTGNRLSPYESFYTTVTADSVFTCYWVMPYKENCEISMENTSNDPVTASLEVYYSDWEWNKNSMHFGSGWTEYNRLHTGTKRSIDGSSEAQDINFVTLTGKGVYVGDAVTLFNPIGDWWGEGDEKVYIDGEDFPSHFGTGTEDYYGYAWCMPNRFEHPFIAQPDGRGAYQPNHVANLRYRSLDGIPFKENLIFDMEFWHQGGTLLNYAPTTYWYMMPGGESNRKAEKELASLPIVKHKNELVSNSPDETGKIEGEYMYIEVKGGMERTQSIIDQDWSNGTQFIWREAGTGDELTMGFNVPEAGKYKLSIRFITAFDYGRFSIALNDKLLIPSFDAYSEPLTSKMLELGVVSLPAGQNTFNMILLPRNPKSHNDLLGVDYIMVEKI